MTQAELDAARSKYGAGNKLGDLLRMADAARARVERRFQPWPGYKWASEYLAFARAGLSGAGVKINWFDQPLTAAAFRREFLAALQIRITCKGPLPRGRKWDGQ